MSYHYLDEMVVLTLAVLFYLLSSYISLLLLNRPSTDTIQLLIITEHFNEKRS